MESDFPTVRRICREERISESWLRAEIRAGRVAGYLKGKRWVRVYRPEVIAHLRSFRVKPVSDAIQEHARRLVAEIMGEGR